MKESGQPIIIIGHKNPDSDSICAAISYAKLKRDLYNVHAIPFRAGNLNAQTSYILDRFNIDIPEFLPDVYPKISDIMIKGKELIILDENDPIGRARDIMIKNRFSFLPVSGKDGRCCGRFTAITLASLLHEVAGVRFLEEAVVDTRTFLQSVNGKKLTSGKLPTTFSGTCALCGAEETSAIEQALRRETDLLIICGTAALTDEVKEQARKAKASIIGTEKDILETAVAFLLSMPVHNYMDREHMTFKPYDLVRDVSREIQKTNEGGFIVIDDDETIQGVIARINFLKQSKFKVILVDHNEFGQAVDGADEADIIEIIDHHRLGTRNTDQPIQFINKVVGSTCTIIAELYKNSGLTPDAATAGIMLSAMISDTVLLKSPTTTDLDREIASWLASLAKLDIQKYGEEMLAAGSALKEMEPEKIITQDQKTYVESGVRFSISQVEVVGFKQFQELETVIAGALHAFLKTEALGFACLMVTDVTHESSLILCDGDSKIIEAITYPREGDNLFEMKGVLSRKKQMLPYFIDVIRGVNQ